MSIAYLHHSDCLKHHMGAGHPERPSRINAIEDQMKVSHLMDFVSYYEAPLATRQQLARVHHEKYIDTVMTFNETESYMYLDPDTILMPKTPQAGVTCRRCDHSRHRFGHDQKTSGGFL
jgi:acetoin utilization deacetylase AcuC-like enzyme